MQPKSAVTARGEFRVSLNNHLKYMLVAAAAAHAGLVGGAAHSCHSFATRTRVPRASLDDPDETYLQELEDALSSTTPPPPQRRLQLGLNLRRDNDPRARRRKPRPDTPVRWTRESTRLEKLPGTIRDAYDDFLERPGQPLLLGSLSMLVGFYMAGALSTIFGAAGFWEPTIALGPLLVGETISRRYYSLPMEQRSQTIRLLQALKVVFLLGIVLDALKLAG